MFTFRVVSKNLNILFQKLQVNAAAVGWDVSQTQAGPALGLCTGTLIISSTGHTSLLMKLFTQNQESIIYVK